MVREKGMRGRDREIQTDRGCESDSIGEIELVVAGEGQAYNYCSRRWVAILVGEFDGCQM